MESWLSFLAQLSAYSYTGVLSPVRSERDYARRCARNHSTPPLDVDITLLAEVADEVRVFRGLQAVYLPELDQISWVSSYYRKIAEAVGRESFRPFLRWALPRVDTWSGSLASPNTVVWALTQHGKLGYVSDYEQETSAKATQDDESGRKQEDGQSGADVAIEAG